MRIGKSRLNLTAGIRLSKNIFFGDGISGALEGRGVFGTSSQALAISPQLAQAAATFGTTSAAQLPYLAQGSNTFGADHSATASSATFLLDEYPGAAAAYSVRLLSSTYSGALVRIRRANDNSEEDFYADSNNELSLNSETSGGTSLSSWVSSENGFIVTIYDQSNAGINATQATASSQPQIINAGALISINSKPAFLFDGINDRLDTSGLNTVLDSTNSTSSFSVTYGNASNGTVFQSATSNRFCIQYDVSGNELTVAYFNGSFHSSSKPNSLFSQNLLSHTWDTSSITGYINNVLNTGTENPSTDGTNASYIGSRTGGSAYLDGYVQELIFWQIDQSSNRAGITTEINNFYSIY